MTATGPQLLLIEDEVQMRRFLRAALVGNGYRLLEAERGEEGLTLAASYNPELILLDLGLPDLDGLEVIRRLRDFTRVPVIVLSARGREAEKVRILDAGADDYVTKPFGMNELLARLRVALRHAELRKPDEPEFVSGRLRIDFARREVRVAGELVRLTPLAFRLLSLLARNAGKVLTHRQLLREVWGNAAEENTHYLRVYMAQLRQKLEEEPSNPQLLFTEPGVGYRLKGEQ